MGEFQHAGVKGMRWGFRKAEGSSSSDRVTIQEQVPQILRREAGLIASREVLRKQGHNIVPVAKAAVKGGVGLLRYSGRVARGAGATVRLLGGAARVSTKFGKAYVKGAVSIAKAVR